LYYNVAATAALLKPKVEDMLCIICCLKRKADGLCKFPSQLLRRKLRSVICCVSRFRTPLLPTLKIDYFYLIGLNNTDDMVEGENPTGIFKDKDRLYLMLSWMIPSAEMCRRCRLSN
jgi:hypothetical protein